MPKLLLRGASHFSQALARATTPALYYVDTPSAAHIIEYVAVGGAANVDAYGTCAMGTECFLKEKHERYKNASDCLSCPIS